MSDLQELIERAREWCRLADQSPHLSTFSDVWEHGRIVRALAAHTPSPATDGLREAVEALADECASSSCIHLNEMWGRLRAALAPTPPDENPTIAERTADE